MEKLTFVPSPPLSAPVTKLGGQPVWLSAPSWPLSRETGEPMAFVGQFRLPGTELRMAYLFMSSDADDTFEPEGGENAFFCQPGRVPSFIRCSSSSSGPTYSDQDHVVAVSPAPDDTDVWNRIGGSPHWLQNSEIPAGATHFVAQLDSCALPFQINFGDAGVGYAFVDDSTGEGRFLWQCC